MPTNSNKGQSKGKASAAALDHEEEFRKWAHDEASKKKLNWFPNSPPSPTGR